MSRDVDAASPRGRLVLVGTPLGNREDLSPRARRALLEADLLLCEDTRSPTRLLGDAVRLPPRVSCFVGNEHERVTQLLEALAEGKTVAFVSEAGMPVWSDPGQRLVDAALQAGFEVDAIPGPVAATLALAVSGFPAEGARFWGFLPRSGSPRAAALAAIATDTGPALIYEAGPRMKALLTDLAGVPALATRRVVIGRELTKLHQEIERDVPAALLARPRGGQRGEWPGEFTVVIEGQSEEVASPDDPVLSRARAVLDAMLDPRLRPRERAKRLAALVERPAGELYEALLGGPRDDAARTADEDRDRDPPP
jgi:16S rRNA (cytidine1402-2'-O)-methyltransferase